MNQRYDVWQGSIDCIYDVDAKPEIRKNDFTATIEAHLVGSSMMTRTATRQQSYTRSSTSIARDGMDHYFVQFYLSGVLAADHAKGGTEVAQGGLLVCDLTQKAEARASDMDTINLILPRVLLEDKLTLPDDHNMRFLSPKDPMVRMLTDHMMSLQRNIGSLDSMQRGVIEGSVSRILASCLNTAQGETRDTLHARRTIAIQTMIRRYFREHFSSPDLTPERAAQDLGLSRSRLYQLLEAQGGVYRYVRTLRLRHAMSLLTDAFSRHRSIYDIALECGFSSDSSFIRAFREEFGITPGDARNVAPRTKNASKFGNSMIDTRYEEWLAAL